MIDVIIGWTIGTIKADIWFTNGSPGSTSACRDSGIRWAMRAAS
jgi:hypothetical protein